jgi:hypothetical protein
MNYHNPENERNEQNLTVLADAADAPDRAYAADQEVRDAFEAELRQLAEDIVAHHPSLTQLLLSLSGDGTSIGVRDLSPIHGQN